MSSNVAIEPSGARFDRNVSTTRCKCLNGVHISSGITLIGNKLLEKLIKSEFFTKFNQNAMHPQHNQEKKTLFDESRLCKYLPSPIFTCIYLFQLYS